MGKLEKIRALRRQQAAEHRVRAPLFDAQKPVMSNAGQSWLNRLIMGPK